MSEVIISEQPASVDDPSAFERQDVFRFMSLPPELRRKVYYFAILEPHPLPLIARYGVSDHYSAYYAVEKDLRMLETCREFRAEMKNLPYSENSFSFSIRQSELEKGTKMFPVDLTRIQKCYISVTGMKDSGGISDEDDEDDKAVFCTGVQDIQDFVATLVFKGHQMKYLLVECEPQDCHFLAVSLSPLSMLRRIRSVRFRSCRAEMHHYFRFLEGLMMGSWPVHFSDLVDFWEDYSIEDDLLTRPEESWLVEGRDVATSVVVKSEAQMEATAKDLYSILGIEHDFIPQGELDETCPFWHVGKEKLLVT